MRATAHTAPIPMPTLEPVSRLPPLLLGDVGVDAVELVVQVERTVVGTVLLLLVLALALVLEGTIPADLNVEVGLK